MPSEAQYAIFHEGKSQQCIERKPAIVNTGRNGIFAVENQTKNYTSQLRSLWITRARSTFENDKFQVRLLLMRV